MKMLQELAIVKLGGSILTDKQVPFSLRVHVLNRIALELSQYNGPLLIVHGGGSFGHSMATAFDYSNNRLFSNPYGVANIHYAMRILNNALVKVFLNSGLNAISIEPISYLYTSNGLIKKVFLQPFKQAIEHNLVPVTFGDIVFDDKLESFIVSGDDLIGLLASALKATKIVLCTDVDGVFAEINGQKKLINEINKSNIHQILTSIQKLPEFSKQKIDVTGGMYHKIKELWKLAEQGISSFIINGLVPNRLKKILLNDYSDVPHTLVTFR